MADETGSTDRKKEIEGSAKRNFTTPDTAATGTNEADTTAATVPAETATVAPATGQRGETADVARKVPAGDVAVPRESTKSPFWTKRKTWRLRRFLWRVFEVTITAPFFALIVGLMLQNANDATDIRDSAIQLVSRTNFAVRAAWDKQTPWAPERKVASDRLLEGLLFDLSRRLPNDLYNCAGEMVNIAKGAPTQMAINPPKRFAAFETRQKLYLDALEEWRFWESVPFFDNLLFTGPRKKLIPCVPK